MTYDTKENILIAVGLLVYLVLWAGFTVGSIYVVVRIIKWAWA